MINKIKELVYKYIPSGLITIFIVGILLIFSLIIMFFVYYKKPISLNNEIAKNKIENMIHKQNIEGNIKNIKLSQGIIYTSLKDSIINKSNKIDDENDILYYTRILNYNVINDSDSIHYITIFEIDEKFLKEDIGQHLITFKK